MKTFPLFPSDKHTILTNSIPVAVVDQWQKEADSTYDQLYEDHFSNMTKESYYATQFGHTAPIARLGAWRLFGTAFCQSLRENFLKPLGLKNEDYYLVPLYYLRYTFPELYQTDLHKAAYLCSQPHYDRAFNIFAQSFWVPLMDVTDQTGGICFFYDQQSVEAFSPLNGKNRYNYQLYLDNASKLDSIVAAGCVHPHFSKGSVATFNSDILHGAKKAVGAWRRSFDFRIFEKSQFEQLDTRTKKIVLLMNRDPDILSILSLATFHDDAGAERKLAKHVESALTPLLQTTLKKIHSTREDFDPRNPNSLIPYQKEFAWADAIEDSAISKYFN